VKLFELSDYVDVLAAVGEADLDLIMVGGNAVSFYAEKYRLTCSELNPLLPVLSKDTDWLGSVEAGMKLANRLQANWKQNPRKGGMLGLSLGHVELPSRPEVKVEISAIFSAPILKRFVRQLFLRTTKETDFG
jgi:hypothetical protein